MQVIQVKWDQLGKLLAGYGIVLLVCPALLMFTLSSELNLIGLNGLVYRRVCLDTFNRTMCDKLIDHRVESLKVQELSSSRSMQLNIMFIVPAMLAIVHFFGRADRRLNYRVPLLISLAGCLLNTFVLTFATTQTSGLHEGLCFLAQFANGLLGGGSLCFISACFSHISVYEEKLASKELDNDIDTLIERVKPDTNRYRSIRFALCEACLLLGQFFGSLISGHLIGNKTNLSSFQRTFGISFLIYLVVLFYVLAMFRYLKCKKANTCVETVIKKNLFVDELSFLSDSVKILFKKRSSNGRFQILALLGIYFAGASISMGLGGIQYLYLVKKPIQLSQVDYGLFKALNVLTRTVALLIVLPMLKHVGVPDYYFYIIGLTSELLNLVIFALASSVNNIIWTAPFVYMFANYFVVCIRIFASKLVDPNETGKYIANNTKIPPLFIACFSNEGKMFGIIAMVEFMVLLLSSSVITMIYKATVATMPYLIYAICILVCLLFCFPFIM